MKDGITLKEVRSEALDAIERLKNGEMDVRQAMAIKGLLDTVVNTAKTQVEFIRALPNSAKEQLSTVEIKAIAGSLNDSDAELDISMNEIERRRSIPYQLAK